MAAADASRTVVAGATRTNTVFSAPSGIANGDVLLCLIQTGSDPVRTVTPPAGWSAVSTFPITMTSFGGDTYVVRQHAFIKVASGESGSYTFSHSSAWTEGVLTRCTGIDNTTPIDATPTTDNHTPSSGGNSVTAPTITTTVNDSLIFYWGGVWDGFGNASPPSGSTPTFTERANDTAGVFYAASGVLATAGATGAKTVTVSQGDNRPWMAGLIALRASAGGGSITLAGTADGVSTATAATFVNRTLAASSTGVATATASVGVGREFAGSAAGSSSTIAFLTQPVLFAASAVGSSTTTAGLSNNVALAASAAGLSTAAAAFNVSLAYAGSASGIASADASVSVARTMAASAAGLSTADAAVAVSRTFAASAAGISTTSGVLGVSITFAASATGTSTAIAAFAGDLLLAGSASGIATASASFGINQQYAASATGGSTSTATLEVQRSFAASAGGLASAGGSLQLNLGFAAAASGLAATAGSFSVQIGFAGSASGLASTTASLTIPGEIETTDGPYRSASVDTFFPGMQQWAAFIHDTHSIHLSGRSD